MYYNVKLFINAVSVIGIVFLHCSGDFPFSAPEDLSGNCVGMVKDENGAPVPGATVFLVPEKYAPLSSNNSDRIDTMR